MYKLKLSTVAAMFGVSNFTRFVSIFTSSLNKSESNLTVNVSPAGQDVFGANPIALSFNIYHSPRINGVIFILFGKSSFVMPILNAGAYGPESKL